MMMMVEDIVELQHKLMEAQGRLEERIKPYAARCQKDVESLSKIGMTPEEISYVTDVPLYFIRKHKGKIEREKTARRRFLMTGQLPEMENAGVGVFSILQK
jgi:hypothetical protein